MNENNKRDNRIDSKSFEESKKNKDINEVYWSDPESVANYLKNHGRYGFDKLNLSPTDVFGYEQILAELGAPEDESLANEIISRADTNIQIMLEEYYSEVCERMRKKIEIERRLEEIKSKLATDPYEKAEVAKIRDDYGNEQDLSKYVNNDTIPLVAVEAIVFDDNLQLRDMPDDKWKEILGCYFVDENGKRGIEAETLNIIDMDDLGNGEVHAYSVYTETDAYKFHVGLIEMLIAQGKYTEEELIEKFGSGIRKVLPEFAYKLEFEGKKLDRKAIDTLVSDYPEGFVSTKCGLDELYESILHGEFYYENFEFDGDKISNATEENVRMFYRNCDYYTGYTKYDEVNHAYEYLIAHYPNTEALVREVADKECVELDEEYIATELKRKIKELGQEKDRLKSEALEEKPEAGPEQSNPDSMDIAVVE